MVDNYSRYVTLAAYTDLMEPGRTYFNLKSVSISSVSIYQYTEAIHLFSLKSVSLSSVSIPRVFDEFYLLT